MKEAVAKKVEPSLAAKVADVEQKLKAAQADKTLDESRRKLEIMRAWTIMDANSAILSNLASERHDMTTVAKIADLKVMERVLKKTVARCGKGTGSHCPLIEALSHVNLCVRQGESYGVIGRNGAGKTTLMKVIARVLRPTEGTVTIRGQVAPLLELGAGFDADTHQLSLIQHPYAVVVQ